MKRRSCVCALIAAALVLCVAPVFAAGSGEKPPGSRE